MSTLAEPSHASPPARDVIDAARRFFQADRTRILTVASGLRGPDRTLESTVFGASMGWTIPEGSRIRIDLEAQRRYRPGEVIAYVASQNVIVHRVVHSPRRRPGDYVLTRGDAEMLPDPPVGSDRVLGAVTAVQRDGDWVPVEHRHRLALPARVLAPLILALVTCALHASPGAAATVVRVLHGGRRRLLGVVRRAAGRVRR